jgi:hypothetical protein
VLLAHGARGDQAIAEFCDQRSNGGINGALIAAAGRFGWLSH